MKRVWLALLAAMCLAVASPVYADDVFVRIGTSSVGGGFYLIGNTIAQLGTEMEKSINFTAVTEDQLKTALTWAPRSRTRHGAVLHGQ